MADSAIRAAGGANAPLSYLVPGAAVIRIKQIHVKYADNGAGGDWLPAVRIVDDAGHTMGTAADQGVKVTAGSDADVSFFPGVKHAATGGAADLSCAICQLDIGTGNFANGTHILPISNLFTNAPSFYSIDPIIPAKLVTSGNGFFLVQGRISLSVAQLMDAQIAISAGGDGVPGATFDLSNLVYDATHKDYVVFMSGVTFSDNTATDWFSFTLNNFTPLANVAGASMVVVKLSDTRL